ncbi:MAG: NAD-dependent epimerase/dehydratase family protein, partial [Planctomycetota bacterium]
MRSVRIDSPHIPTQPADTHVLVEGNRRLARHRRAESRRGHARETGGMILLTGAAGFIGSNILRALNRQGRDDVIAVDDLTDGRKCANLVGCSFADYLDVTELRAAIAADRLPRLSGICHQGGCADTTVSDGRAVMQANYSFTKEMLALAERHGCGLVYASSAAVYGDG